MPQLIRGTRTWANGLTITSTGSDALDAILGIGVGVPLGSVILILEDFPSRVHRAFSSVFVAECVTHGHSLVTLEESGEFVKREILGNLPGKGSSKISGKKSSGNVEMNIAWRYEKYGNSGGVARSSNMAGGALTGGGLAGVYDFRKKEDDAKVETLFLDEDRICRMVQEVKEDEKNVVRILIPSLGDPALYTRLQYKNPGEIVRFLKQLKQCVQVGKKFIALVTLPKILFPDDSDLRSFERFVDASVQLSAFDMLADSGFGEAHGILTVRKLIHLNSFGCQYPDSLNYLYTVQKKGVSVEKMSLPPEESRTGNTAVAKTSESEAKLNIHNIDF